MHDFLLCVMSRKLNILPLKQYQLSMKIKAISISDRKGVRKKNIDSVRLVENFGLEDDAHGGKWHRQVSLLAQESIDTMRAQGLDVVAGNFAENITTEGINLAELQVGTHLLLGETEIIISQLGKVCHHKCAIYHQAGDCVMPREGIFGIVHKGGSIQVGDAIIPQPQISSAVAIVANNEIEEQQGKYLEEIVSAKLSPAFIRFDALNKKESNLGEILDDLINLQGINDIVVIDASGKHALAFVGYAKTAAAQQIYTANNSRIIYCKNIEELRQLD